MLHDVLNADPLTVLTGTGAILFLTFGPAFKSRNGILLAQLAASTCFLGHYLSLGILAAAAVNVLSFTQTVAALLAARSAAMNRLGYGLILLMGICGVWLWQGPTSLLSVTAMSLIALGRMQMDPLRLRLLLLLGGSLWVAHDLINQAWFALAADVGALIVGLMALAAMLVRISIEWRPTVSPLKPQAA